MFEIEVEVRERSGFSDEAQEIGAHRRQLRGRAGNLIETARKFLTRRLCFRREAAVGGTIGLGLVVNKRCAHGLRLYAEFGREKSMNARSSVSDLAA